MLLCRYRCYRYRYVTVPPRPPQTRTNRTPQRRRSPSPLTQTSCDLPGTPARFCSLNLYLNMYHHSRLRRRVRARTRCAAAPSGEPPRRLRRSTSCRSRSRTPGSDAPPRPRECRLGSRRRTARLNCCRGWGSTGRWRGRGPRGSARANETLRRGARRRRRRFANGWLASPLCRKPYFQMNFPGFRLSSQRLLAATNV